jgi:hypothetical protein
MGGRYVDLCIDIYMLFVCLCRRLSAGQSVQLWNYVRRMSK